jgi:hypothetical protein
MEKSDIFGKEQADIPYFLNTVSKMNLGITPVEPFVAYNLKSLSKNRQWVMYFNKTHIPHQYLMGMFERSFGIKVIDIQDVSYYEGKAMQEETWVFFERQ